MNRKTVVIPTPRTLIKPSPGFAKKGLGEYKLDLLGLCGFGCRYCSSNNGNFLRIRRQRFADLTEQQLGERHLPVEEPELTFVFEDVLGALAAELEGATNATR